MLSFNYLKKNLKKSDDLCKVVRIAILADSASQMLTQAIKGYGIEHQVKYEVFEADYDQIDRQIFDPSSELYDFKPNLVILFRSVERALKGFYKKDLEEKEHYASKEIDYVDSLYQTISTHLNAKVIINNFIEVDDAVFGHYASKVRSSFPYQVKKFNYLLNDLSQNRENLFVFNLSGLIMRVGYDSSFDPKMYVSADMVISIEALPLVAKGIHDITQAISGVFKKCIILDLDNTTWGGVIGDDGVEGIQIGQLGIGKVFTDFQLWVKELKKRGVILAVCSKNTEAIAKEPFIHHPDMVLRLEDIAVFVANWETKVDNIRYIQSVLNIGFDSMVFLDDNPFEREMVKSGIPELTVPDLPEDPSEYLAFLRKCNLFETSSFTEEDEQRTKLYQEEAGRTILQKSFQNEGEFLGSLEMKAVVAPFDKFSIPRVAQLSQRSNQFNLRTIRYSEADIAHIAYSDEYDTLSFNLKDKFGDYGLISFVILKHVSREVLFIDSWIMSCRVLKRGMERFVLGAIVELAQRRGFRRVVGEYIPTAKNGIVKDHYERLGFARVEGCWELDLLTFDLKGLETFIERL